MQKQLRFAKVNNEHVTTSEDLLYSLQKPTTIIDGNWSNSTTQLKYYTIMGEQEIRI